MIQNINKGVKKQRNKKQETSVKSRGIQKYTQNNQSLRKRKAPNGHAKVLPHIFIRFLKKK